MNSIKTLHQQAQQLINAGNFPAAHAACVQIVKQDPQHADSYFLLGIINSEVGQFGKAIKLMEKAVSFSPQAEYFAYLAKCLSLTGDMTKALQAIKQISLEAVTSPRILDTVGVALSRIGDHEQALLYFDKALARQQKDPQMFYNCAVSAKFAGQFEKARDGFERAIALKPDYYQAQFALSDLGYDSPREERIDTLTSLLKDKPGVDASLHLGHALAKEYEAHKRYDEAFDVLKQVKQAKKASIQYQFEQDKVLFDHIMEVEQDQAPGGDPSNRPIFVVGMPRSGTTLVERIISNHSQVASGGELQDFGVAVKELATTPSPFVLDIDTLKAALKVDAKLIGQRYLQRTEIVGPGQARFVDKLPFNFFYLHLIRRALPNAKIVCLLRNPMDTCVGNFRQLFSVNSPHYAYAYDMITTARFYAHFYQLDRHWENKGDENFLLLDYEALVTDPENRIPELIEFCDLDWQPQCLAVESNQAPVSTASKVQVREPINTKSLGRWKRYQSQLQEVEAYFQQQDIAY